MRLDACATNWTPLLLHPLKHLVEHLLMAAHFLPQNRLVLEGIQRGGMRGDLLQHLLHDFHTVLRVVLGVLLPIPPRCASLWATHL